MKELWKGAVYIMVFFTILLTGAVSFAQKGDDRTLSPYFFVEGGDRSIDSFPLKKTDVRVVVNGVIADVVVTQKYVNEGKQPINARYVFPASTRAAVQGMKMIFGDQVISAKIKEKQAAQREFDAAKSSGKSASLLHQHRPNVFSMNVANIMPGDVIDIELRYTELLVPTEGVYEFVYPTVVGPRYSSQPEGSSATDDRWIKSPHLKSGEESKMSRWNITADISAGMRLQEVSCPSHETRVDHTSGSTARVSLKEKEAATGGNRDFILRYRLADSTIQTGLMMHDGGKEKFFLLMVQPPKRVAQKDIPPREYVFLVDVSGSMYGYPLDISKELLKNLIGGLRPTDRFNVILFAGGSHLMSDSSLPASPENISAAVRLIDSQRGGGGTELLAALQRALSLPRDTSFSRTVIIATDGYIGSEKGVFDTIRRNLSQTNFFGFGIGSSVNRHLMEGIARAGQGEAFIVTGRAEAARQAERFCTYVSSPVLKNVNVSYKGLDAYDMEPKVIPEMFAERPLVIVGKWRGEAKGEITVTGTGGQGDFRKTVQVTGDVVSGSNKGLPYLWARTRISSLSDLPEEGDENANRAEITRLGLEYGLLTRYTSFIAVRDVVRNPRGSARDVDQPLPLPKGVSELAVGDSSANVPEPEFYALASLMLITAAAGFLWRRRRSLGTCRRRSL